MWGGICILEDLTCYFERAEMWGKKCVPTSSVESVVNFEMVFGSELHCVELIYPVRIWYDCLRSPYTKQLQPGEILYHWRDLGDLTTMYLRVNMREKHCGMKKKNDQSERGAICKNREIIGQSKNNCGSVEDATIKIKWKSVEIEGVHTFNEVSDVIW